MQFALGTTYGFMKQGMKTQHTWEGYSDQSGENAGLKGGLATDITDKAKGSLALNLRKDLSYALLAKF